MLLGTVQLGLAYGRRAEHGEPDANRAVEILDMAWQLGIRAFDTAEAYGDAAARLAGWIDSRGIADACEVVTKVRAGDAGNARAIGEARGRFGSLARCVVLTHGPVNPAIFAAFRDRVIDLGAEPGASVYEASEVRMMAEAGARRIQAPLNAFDLRQLDAARSAGVPLDGRSVYLQGVLLESPEEAERRAPGAGRLATAVQEAARRVGMAPAPAVVAAAFASLGSDDRLVIGVDSPSELDAIRQGCEIESDGADEFLRTLRSLIEQGTIDARTLDPRKWRAT